MKVTMNDISKRIYNQNHLVKNADFNINSAELYSKNNAFNENNAKYMIEHWCDFDDNSNVAFNRALDVFEEVCLNCNDSTIRTMANVLKENVNKVRDASALLNSIKYRNSRFKTKILTKINTKNNIVSNAINDTIGNINSKLQVNGIANSGAKSTVSECYDMLIYEAKKCIECDRIIKNYNKVSKRFNLDKVVSEICYDNDNYQAIYEIASYIDTYNNEFKNKYNAALENAYYVYNKHFMNYPSDKIIEAVTDYFAFNTYLDESKINDIKSIIDNSVLFESADFDVIKYLFDQEPITENTTPSAVDSTEEYGVNLYLENDISKLKSDVKQWFDGNPDEREKEEINKMMDDFRKQCAKDDKNDNNTLISTFKAIIKKMYNKSPYHIINKLPNIFSIFRAAFVLSSLYINPVLGILAVITDCMIKINFNRKYYDKVLKAYSNEIDSVKKKIEKSNGESKERLEKYLAALKEDKKQIENLEHDIYSDDENDERESEKFANGDYDDFDLGDDWDDDWGDDWDDFEESQKYQMASIILISEMVESVNESYIEDDLDGIIYNNIYKFDNDVIDTITDFSITVPAILEKKSLCNTLESYREELRKSGNISDIIKIDCLNDNITKLKESSNTFNITNNVKGIICYLDCLQELAKCNSNSEYILEMNFTNTLKLAMTKLKHNAMKLSDKEKQISNSIDVSMNSVSKGIEKALTNNNREAVIRGSIIPSASKIIKIALATGAAWAVSPAIAVIGVLGGFACSKKLQAKERQLILDDIEIELKMCERYMRIAEEKNDMKAIRQIEMTQRNLERQRQRIKYKMAVVYNQKVPNIENED